MITREQYLEALELIDKYHRQNDYSTRLIDAENGKTEMKTWFASLKQKPSRRLYNLLLNYRRYGATIEKSIPFKYVEEVNEYDFFKLMYAGKSAWAEFVKLRGY